MMRHLLIVVALLVVALVGLAAMAGGPPPFDGRPSWRGAVLIVVTLVSLGWFLW